MDTRERTIKTLGKSRRVIPTVALLVLLQLIGLMGITVLQMAFVEQGIPKSSKKLVVVYQDDSHTFTSEGSRPTRMLGGTRDFGSGIANQPRLAYLPRQAGGLFRPLI